jgi:uncharacterized protein YecA (UPF0149 family)
MNGLINHEVAKVFFRLQVQAPPEEEAVGPASSIEAGGFKAIAAASSGDKPHSPAEAAAQEQRNAGGAPKGTPSKRTAPSDPCPCGSGSLYRNCHGK